MMIENKLARAQLLLEQNRFDDAEKLLKDTLSEAPNDPNVLSMLAEVHLQLNKIDSADQLIQSAIAIAPDCAPLFYIKARVAMAKEQYDQAEQLLEQGIQLDPADPDFYALWASIKLARKQYQPSLDLANRALELDSEHLLALNTRSTALLKLDRKDDAFQTIEGALREDPNNAFTHANYGWSLLEKGDHKQALEHFREALKNDPNFSLAQAGMMEALKASNPIYRLFLRYAFWIGNLAERGQWLFLIGFYVAFRMLRSVAENVEGLRPFLMPILILLGIVAFSTWIITPISNLFLRLNVYGRHLLDKKEMMSSNFVGLSLLICIAGLIGYLFTQQDLMLMVAVFGFIMMVPCSVMFSPTKSKNALIVYAIVMAGLGIAGIIQAATIGEPFNVFSTLFILGFVIFQWVANYMMIRESNI